VQIDWMHQGVIGRPKGLGQDIFEG
jgi:hypothetical protein